MKNVVTLLLIILSNFSAHANTITKLEESIILDTPMRAEFSASSETTLIFLNDFLIDECLLTGQEVYKQLLNGNSIFK